VKEGRILARSHLLRIGSTLCVGSVDLTDDRRRAIGTAIVTYMLIDGSVAVPTLDVFGAPHAGVSPNFSGVNHGPHEILGLKGAFGAPLRV